MKKNKSYNLNPVLLAGILVLTVFFSGMIFAQAEIKEKYYDEKKEVVVQKEVEKEVVEKKEIVPKEVTVKTKYEPKPTLKIDTNGSITINNGEITHSEWPQLTVEVWGVSILVNITESTSIQGARSAFAGDKVSLSGQMSNGAVNTLSFVNHSQSERERDEIKKKIEALLKQVEALQMQLKNL